MKKIILAVPLILLFMHSASAFTFLNIYVDNSGGAIFLGETDKSPSLPKGITNENGEISGFTQGLTSKEGNTWTFEYSLPDSELNVFLPRGARIISLSNGEIGLSGERITIFAKDSLTAIYTVSPIIQEETKLNIPLLISLIAVLIVLVAFLINYSKRDKPEKSEDFKKLEKQIKQIKKLKPKEKEDKLEVIKQVLSDREKLILEKLKDVGKVKQSQLRKLTEIPKASFSRHVQELEKKQLIRRTGEGKNKFVELTSR